MKHFAEAPGSYLVQRDVRTAVAVNQGRVELHSTRARDQIKWEYRCLIDQHSTRKVQQQA